MGNPITNRLPSDVDNFLQDMAQMEGLFSYGTISEFSDYCTKGDIQKLRNIEKRIETLVDRYDEYDYIPKSKLKKELDMVKEIVTKRAEKGLAKSLDRQQYRETIWNQMKPVKPKCPYCLKNLKYNKKADQLYCSECGFKTAREYW